MVSVGRDYEELSMTMVALPSGLMMGDTAYFNITIINDGVVEEMFENFTVLLSGSSRVMVTGTSSAVVDIAEDQTDSE